MCRKRATEDFSIFYCDFLKLDNYIYPQEGAIMERDLRPETHAQIILIYFEYFLTDFN